MNRQIHACQCIDAWMMDALREQIDRFLLPHICIQTHHICNCTIALGVDLSASFDQVGSLSPNDFKRIKRLDSLSNSHEPGHESECSLCRCEWCCVFLVVLGEVRVASVFVAMRMGMTVCFVTPWHFGQFMFLHKLYVCFVCGVTIRSL